jgi:hypothetical protein
MSMIGANAEWLLRRPVGLAFSGNGSSIGFSSVMGRLL